jgi:hypothetical protein
MAVAKQLLALHQARDDLCAPARTELPTAAVAPLLQLGKAAQLLGGFEPEGRAAVQRAAAILRPFPCDVSGLERWLRAPVDVLPGRSTQFNNQGIALNGAQNKSYVSQQLILQRRTSVRWLPWQGTREWAWAYDRMLSYARKVAEGRWGRYGGVDHIESLQLGEYTAAARGFYDFHTDNGCRHTRERGGLRRWPHDERAARLLSISVQLTEPAEYSGGELQISSRDAPTERGSVVIFPSWALHKVCAQLHPPWQPWQPNAALACATRSGRCRPGYGTRWSAGQLAQTRSRRRSWPTPKPGCARLW